MRPAATVFLAASAAIQLCVGAPLPKDDGYRGIWYCDEATKDEYKFKHSGGMATYPQQHAPIAIYSPAANKTFFCGSPPEPRHYSSAAPPVLGKASPGCWASTVQLTHNWAR